MGITIKDYIENNLTEKERLVIYNRLGIYGHTKTLEEVGKILNKVTRERIRQIERKAYQKLKQAIETGIIIEKDIGNIISSASRQTLLEDIDVINKDYSSTLYINIIANIFRDQIEIIDHPAFGGKSIIVLRKFPFKRQVDSLILELSQSNRLKDLDDLSVKYGIRKDIILAMAKIVMKENDIALETNRNLFYHKGTMTHIYDILKQTGRPMKIKEIAEKGNLTLNQVRGAIVRVPGVLNVGLSTYALEDWGYIKGWASDIAYYYLEQAGQPMSTKNITSLVLKQKRIKPGSIRIAMSLDERIQYLNTGYWVLKKWGYEDVRTIKNPRKIYAVESKAALVEILKENRDYLSIKNIIDQIKRKYGGSTSDNLSLYYLILCNLVKEGKVSKIKNGKYCYYKLNR